MQPVNSILRDLDPQGSMRSGLAAYKVSCVAHILGTYVVLMFGLVMKRPPNCRHAYSLSNFLHCSSPLYSDI